MRQPTRASATMVLLVLLSTLVAPAVGGATPPDPLWSDDFQRVVPAGWGGDYTVTGTTVDASVDGAGVLRHARPGSFHRVALDRSRATNVDVTATVSTSTPASGWGQVLYLVARRNAVSGSEYAGRLRFAGDGSVWLAAEKVIDGTDQQLGPEQRVAGATHRAGATFRVRLQVTGSDHTRIQAKAWAADAAEPTSWAVEVTDDEARLLVPGELGLRTRVSSSSTGGTTFRLDDVHAVAVPGGPSVAPEFGAAPLGTTRYPIPADAVFVSPSGDDANTGTQASPYRTIQHAVDRAPSGATIVLRGGEYRESVRAVNKRLTFQNHPGEVVWLSGSRVVTSWRTSGSAWVHTGWPHVQPSTRPASWAPYANHPMAFHLDMLFLDGVEQRQVGSRSAVVPGTFYVDPAAKAVYLGSNPNGRKVEMAVDAEALYVKEGHGSIIRGIGVRHYATPHNRVGALKMHASNSLVENVVVTQNATIGLGLMGTNITARAVTASDNGQVGITADLSSRVTITRSHVSGNNTAGFGPGSAEGGVKLAAVTDSVLSRNLVEGNQGQGLWSDVSSRGINYLGNVVRHNTRNGIQVELTARSVVADNLVYGNEGNGTLVVESHDVDVWNNTFSRNRVNLQITEGARRSGDPAVTHDVDRITVRNNVLSNVHPTTGGNYLFGVDDAAKRRSADEMTIYSGYNAYFNDVAGTPRWTVAWSQWPVRMLALSTLAEAKANGVERTSLSTTGGRNPYLHDEGAGRFGRPPDSPAIGAGLPLNARVAAALNLPAGTTVDIGALSR